VKKTERARRASGVCAARRIGDARARDFFKPGASTRLGKRKIKKF
jgi:hypothetical protein